MVRARHAAEHAGIPRPQSAPIDQRRPVLLLIDVEPDARKIRRDAAGWEGSRQAFAHLARLRRQLEDATGARVQFNWFLRADPQIRATWGRADWIVEACPGLVRTIEDEDDFCGIHPHLWRWNAARAHWFNELHDPAWTAECLHTAIDAFRGIFHRAPEACRFGDRWLDQTAVELVAAAGIRYDLTIEPGLPDQPIHDDPHATGWLPDYRAAPREPYQPSAEDFLVPHRAPSADQLWMVPLTTTPPAWRLVRRPPYVLRASRSANLSLCPSHVWNHLRQQLQASSAAPLTIVFRTGDVATPRFLRNFLRTSRALTRCPALAQCEFTNPVSALVRWQGSR